MAHLKLIWIGFHFGSLIILGHLSDSVTLSLELPAPPVPVNQTLNRSLLEYPLENGTSPQCSTDDGEGLSLTRNGMIASSLQWTSFNVYPDPSYDDHDRGLINAAMWTLSQALPCIHFGIFPRDATPWGDYVHIKKGNGCWSKVGRQGGAQDMSLQSRYCMKVGIIMHELLHALGFHHEHCRTDRDEHVNILWHNVRSGLGFEYNFRKYSASEVTSFSVPYNQRSIMHYGSTYFSGNGLPTIEAKDGGEVGPTRELQSTDIDKLRRMNDCY